MSEGISFDNLEKSEKAIRDTWSKFRDDLAKGLFNYDEVQKAKSSIFLKTYDDLFRQHSGITLQTIELGKLTEQQLGRGAIIKDTEKRPITYERFIPQKEFIKEDNRFSPSGVEWLYLSVGTNDVIKECAAAECRAKSGEEFGFCHFEIDSTHEKCKLVDLTFADNLSYDDINNKFSAECKRFEVEKKKAIRQGCFDQDVINGKRIKTAITWWSVYTHTKLLSEQIFVPLNDGDNKGIMYAPFQTMAQYYISLGYSGIIFSSTVCPIGKNVVIFDKNMATPIGKISITKL